MKRQFFLHFILIFLNLNLSSQSSCLPGGITLISQSEIDAFPSEYPGCTEIEGDVIVSGADIVNLNGLSQIELIDGNLMIQQNPNLSNLNGLQNLMYINEFLALYQNNILDDISALSSITTLPQGLGISGNPQLTSLEGLNNLTIIGTTLISNNAILNDITALSNLTTINGYLRIISNGGMQNLNGLQALTTVTSQVEIMGNNQLETLIGLDNLTSIGRWLQIENNAALNSLLSLSNLVTINSNNTSGYLSIINNDNLTTLNGLDNLDDNKITSLNISNSLNLSTCNVESICNYLTDPNNSVSITGNATGCTSIPEVLSECNINVPICTNLTNPLNGTIDVPINSNLSWNQVTTAAGYKLTIGTTPGGSDILNNQDVGNVTTYDPSVDFPYFTTIYVVIIPYNIAGDATGCIEESFSTLFPNQSWHSLNDEQLWCCVYGMGKGQGNNLYFMGNFTIAGNTPLNKIAKFDGFNWSEIGSGPPLEDNSLLDIEIDNDENLYLLSVSPFNLNCFCSHFYIHKWNGSSWTEILNTTNDIESIQVTPSGNLYIMGVFSNIGGVPANNIAYLNGSSWQALGDGIGNYGEMKLFSNGNLYVANTASAGGQSCSLAKWNGAEWIVLSTEIFNSPVLDIEQGIGEDLYVCGYFTSIGGLPYNRIAKWNGSVWSQLGTGFNDYCRSLVFFDDKLYAGGYFTVAGGIDVNLVAQWDGSEWTSLGDGLTGSQLSQVYEMLLGENNDIIAGGEFSNSGNEYVGSAAKWGNNLLCSQLTLPLNGATEVPVSTNINWVAVPGATGYRLTIGTSSGGSEILDNLNVGNIITYDPISNLPDYSTIYITIIPYNLYGDATGCVEENFLTEQTDFCDFITNGNLTLYSCNGMMINPEIGKSLELNFNDFIEDYIYSGTPLHAIVLQYDKAGNNFVKKNVVNSSMYEITNISLTKTSSNTMVWNGEIEPGFTLSRTYAISEVSNELTISNQVCNNTNQILSNIYLLDKIDFDNIQGCYNYSFYTDVLPESKIAMISSCNANYDILFQSGNPEISVAGAMGFANLSPQNIYNDPYDPNGAFVDLTADLVYHIGNLAPGQCQTVNANTTTNPQLLYCTNLINPIDGAINVSVASDLTWAPAINATGYKLSIGTMSGGTDVLNNHDLGLVTTYNPPINFPYSTTFYVTIVPYNLDGDAIGCIEESFSTEELLPACTNLTTPLNGATNVPVTTNLTWESSPEASGYRLTIGTSSGGTNILNYQDIGNTTTYNPSLDFPYETTIFVTIIPYNSNGDAIGCIEESFSTESIIIQSPLLVSLTSNCVKIKYFAPISAATANSSNLKIWGDETGLRSGTYSVSVDTVIFLSNQPFRTGELIHITSKSGLLFNGGGPTISFSWIRQSEVTNQTNASFRSIGTGIMLPSSAYAYSSQATMADMNRDGLQDIVYRYYSSYGAATNILVYLRNANGTFATPLTYTNTDSHSALIGTPDLNGDGYPDVVISHNVPSKIQVRLNNGSGGLGGPSYYTVTNYCNFGKIADMDNDGDLDIITFSGNSSLSLNTISILKNNGNGTFATQQTTNTSVFGSSCIPADLDNDGDMDIIYTSNNAFSSSKVFRVYSNNGAGVLSLSLSESNPSAKTIKSAFDYNGDVYPDLISDFPSTDIYLNNQGFSYSLNSPTFILSEASYALSGDLDGDSDLDIFIPNSNNGTNYNSPLKIALNNGSGVFTMVDTSTLIMPAISTQDMSDYDSDGDLDHIYLNSTTGEIMVTLNNCRQITTLTADDNPLSGIYMASEMIIIDGNVMVLPTSAILLKAPVVKVNNGFSIENQGNITISPYGCGILEGTISSLDCSAAVINGTISEGVSAVGVSVDVPYSGGNTGVHFGQITHSTGISGLTATLEPGSFASGDGNLNYIITGTPSGSGTAMFTLNIGGQTCDLSVPVSAQPFVCGTSTVTFTYNGAPVTYGTVMSAGRCWLDRNLGATRVAESSDDSQAYGDLFQWGRLDDGHQVRTSGTTTDLSTSDVPGHGNFILAPDDPYDWRLPQNNNLWQGEVGTNNPCPDGYRLPTFTEWHAERTSWSTNNRAGAYASPLKLTVAGQRYRFDGTVNDEGSLANYWSSTVNGTNSWILTFYTNSASMINFFRAYGYSVRCLKDEIPIGLIQSIDCPGAFINGTLTEGIATSGVSAAVGYTGGNGGTHSGQTVASTGVTGLIATLPAGSFATGSGTLTYDITGTPDGSGTTVFALNIGGQTCDLSVSVQAAVPTCTNLTEPLNGATNVSIATNLTWAASANATGYKLTAGTASGGTDILNDQDVGNVLTYDLVSDLPYATTIYVTVIPYNLTGDAMGCTEESFTTENAAFNCGTSTVTFDYNGSTVTYGTVMSAGRCWLDRNLGASRVAESSDDSQAYGDLFQWGRLDDAHQVRTSGTTIDLSTSDVPGHGNFIKGSSNPYDWRSPQNNNLWHGESGTNNPCPDGYRLPTNAEWTTERASWSTNNSAGAFASPLKLPMAGGRDFFGTVLYEGSYGFYWSSTVNGTDSWRLYFLSGNANTDYNDRALGMSVRCLKD